MKPYRPPAPARATNMILIGCVAVQALVSLLGASAFEELVYRAGLIPARLSGVVEGIDGAMPAPLTLLTSLFIHAGWFHLGMNAVFLLLVGRHVEWVLGPTRLVMLFVAGGTAAGFAQTLADPASVEPVIGASGAISAIFGCYAVLFGRRKLGTRNLLGLKLSGELLTSLWFLTAWIALQLLTGAVLNGPGGGIAIWAHIGGFATGLLYAHLLTRRPRSNA